MIDFLNLALDRDFNRPKMASMNFTDIIKNYPSFELFKLFHLKP
ncbi:hypothetical protein Javan350_0016 [Streptococcus phage Javan350]|nr:hypothetical protein Javan350_0016 [Streptococcus phage Javan350]